MSEELQVIHVERPDKELFDRAQTFLVEAKAAGVASDEQAVSAGNELSYIKALQKKLEDKRTSITKPLNDALRAVNDLFRPAKTWLEEAETLRKRAILGYREEQERKVREEQRRLEDEARKERERLAAAAAEADRKASELKTEKAREAATAKADALRAQAQATVAPTVAAPSHVKMGGQAVRETWTYEIVDATLLPREYLMPDERKLAGVVKVMKASTNVPGIRVIRGEALASRAAVGDFL